ncbi:preprotein translocase subunit SecE [uncultured Corynebacterium sp.]|uniref:preprotein translocase subunit SecE n=1 Tax=uncultured Corynebacterium sp. TaxID=159447 RepID=UPI00261EEEF9|nr:preprotein translocase subunit SecE [uncultured Corynebacterium sp.]
MTNPNGQNPAQPTGKRQLRGVSPVSTDAYEQKRTPAQPDADGESKKSNIAAFPGEVVEEMRKVIWPTGKEMLNYTLIVFAFLIVLTIMVWGTDRLAAMLVEWIFIR